MKYRPLNGEKWAITNIGYKGMSRDFRMLLRLEN